MMDQSYIKLVGIVAAVGLVVIGAVKALPAVFYDRGVDATREQHYTDAIGWFSRAIALKSDFEQAYFGRALAHWRKGEMMEAIADYTTVLRLEPEEASAFYNRGLIYEELGNPESALADFGAFVAHKPADPDGHTHRAEIYAQLGDFPRALAEHDALIKLSDRYLPHYFGRAELRRDFDDIDGAIGDVEAAMAIAPDDAEAHRRRGDLRRQRGDTAGAIEDFERAIALKPDDLRSYLARGEAYLAEGRVDAAKAEFEDVVKRAPTVATGYMRRGAFTLFALGDAAAAAADLDTAVRKGFDYNQNTRFLEFSFQAARHELNIPAEPSTWQPRVAPDVPFVPAIYYLVTWRRLARQRAALADDDFRKDAASLGVDSWREVDMTTPPMRLNWRQRVRWPGPILALFAGKATPDTVRRAAATAAAPYTQRLRLCEADFYLAEFQLAQGATAAARPLLEAALAHCPMTAPEAVFAKAELQRTAISNQ